VHDILGTEDGRGSNRYFYKNSLSDGSLMKIGPVWDLDNIFAIKDDWSQQHSGNYRFYYKYLLEYASFKNEFQNQWTQVKYTLYDDIVSFLDNLKTECGEDLDFSRYQDSQRWKKSTFVSLEEEIAKVDAWMKERVVWIDENINVSTCVEYVRFEEGVVYVRVLGACQGCAYIDDDIKEGVEMILMEEVPGVTEVVSV
jgi:Fe-S cluster biogenesis protein NfuA